MAPIIVMLLVLNNGNMGVNTPVIPGFESIEACERAIPKVIEAWHWDRYGRAECVDLTESK